MKRSQRAVLALTRPIALVCQSDCLENQRHSGAYKVQVLNLCQKPSDAWDTLTARHLLHVHTTALLLDHVIVRVQPAHAGRIVAVAMHDVRSVHIVDHLRYGRTELQMAVVAAGAQACAEVRFGSSVCWLWLMLSVLCRCK